MVVLNVVVAVRAEGNVHPPIHHQQSGALVLDLRIEGDLPAHAADRVARHRAANEDRPARSVLPGAHIQRVQAILLGHFWPTGGPFLLCRSWSVFSGSVILPQ